MEEEVIESKGLIECSCVNQIEEAENFEILVKKAIICI